jgi:hypothetical protein
VRLGFLLDAAPSPHCLALVNEAAELLREFGAEVDVLEAAAAGAERRDLEVLAGESAAALSAAARRQLAGAPFLDPYPALAGLCDRAATLSRLAAVGLAVAPRHSRARPSHVLDCMGGQVFGALHGGAERRDVPFTIEAGLRYVGIEAARALGLSLFTLELVQVDDRLAVSGVRPFPCLRGVPDSALRLADFLYAAAEHAAGSAHGAGAAPDAGPNAMSRLPGFGVT